MFALFFQVGMAVACASFTPTHYNYFVQQHRRKPRHLLYIILQPVLYAATSTICLTLLKRMRIIKSSSSMKTYERARVR